MGRRPHSRSAGARDSACAGARLTAGGRPDGNLYADRIERRSAHKGGLVTNLDGLTMFVSSTADDGVVNGDTRLAFFQRGIRVVARYAGGRIARGWLVGRWAEDTLHFRYAQREEGRAIHAGHSVCRARRLPDGRLQLVEHFAWSTRLGSGVNVFEELPKAI